MKTMIQSHNQRAADSARLLDRLPAGSRITSQMTSEDAGRSAQHLVIVNHHSEDLNRDALRSLMRADGYQVEQEVTPDAADAADAARRRSRSTTQAGGKTLYFNAPGKEAMAVIARNGDNTSIVLNTVAKLGSFK